MTMTMAMGSNGGITLMERLRRKPILFLFAVSVLIFYVTPFYHFGKPTYVAFPLICKNGSCQQAAAAASMALSLWETETHPDYVVYTTGCKIMDMNPFDKSVKRFLKKGKPVRCSSPFSKMDGMKLTIDENRLKALNMKNPKCCYREIQRVQQRPDKYNKDADFTIRYAGPCQNIPLGQEGRNVNVSFMKVECHGSGKIKGTVEFQAAALPPQMKSEEVRKKAAFWDERKSQGFANDVPSILVIGIDSISRMHLIRSLPKTREFLESNDFIEMRGYTKVGENTFPNIMAGFGGMELNNYSSCWTGKSMKLDDCPYLWKNFSKLNYTTAFLEDSPGIAIFNYLKIGFVLPPADYYMRPLTVAMNQHNGWGRVTARSGCVGGLSPTDFQASFIKDFMKRMGKAYPYFLLSWFTSIGHDDFNGLQTADNTFRKLFETALSNSSANPDNTVIIFMSDHGYRFGNFRETFLGFYEESLPFFFFRLPPSLKEKHPEWYTILKRNSRQLTSPLDLHSTLTQILNEASATLNRKSDNSTPLHSSESRFDVQYLSTYNDNELSPNLTAYSFDNASEYFLPQFRSRYSFFEFIPNNRTCESATIPQRYCMCGVTPAVSRTSSLSSHLGDIVVSHINYMLQSVINSGKCVVLKFSKFLYGRQVGHGDVWNNFNKLIGYKDYLVALEATPSKAHFEAKIRILHNSTTRILGDITRINSYQGQSDCISDFKLKSYCYCKTLLESKSKTKKTDKSKNAQKPKNQGKNSSSTTTMSTNASIVTTRTSIFTTITRTTSISPIQLAHQSLKLNSTQGNNNITSSTNRHINHISDIGKPK